VLFPDDELRILAYNRYLAVDAELAASIAAAIDAAFGVEPAPDGIPLRRGEVRFYHRDRWASFAIPPQAGSGVVDRLDLSLFDAKVLRPFAGITDQRTDRRIDFVGGVGAVDELSRRVDREGGLAFSFYPVSVEELIAVSDSGQMMPPKSTWFSPKLRSGLFVHRFG